MQLSPGIEQGRCQLRSKQRISHRIFCILRRHLPLHLRTTMQASDQLDHFMLCVVRLLARDPPLEFVSCSVVCRASYGG